MSVESHRSSRARSKPKVYSQTEFTHHNRNRNHDDLKGTKIPRIKRVYMMVKAFFTHITRDG